MVKGLQQPYIEFIVPEIITLSILHQSSHHPVHHYHYNTITIATTIIIITIMHQCHPLYINFLANLQIEDFNPYFSGRKRLLPRHIDLSFYNWDSNHSTSNSTPNYQVIFHYPLPSSSPFSNLLPSPPSFLSSSPPPPNLIELIFPSSFSSPSILPCMGIKTESLLISFCIRNPYSVPFKKCTKFPLFKLS